LGWPHKEHDSPEYNGSDYRAWQIVTDDSMNGHASILLWP